MPATALLAAIGAGILRKWRIGLLLVIVLCAANIPIDREELSTSHGRIGAARLQSSFRSAAPGDAVVFFPFYTRIMLDYYSGQHADRRAPRCMSSLLFTTAAART